MIHKERIRGTVLVVLALVLSPAVSYTDEILDDVILITRDKEILAFSSAGNQWVVAALRAREQIVESGTASQVAVVVTSQRALGFSPSTNQWTEMKIDVGEEMQDLEAKGFVASVNTNFRALGFGARKGEWKEYRYRYR